MKGEGNGIRFEDVNFGCVYHVSLYLTCALDFWRIWVVEVQDLRQHAGPGDVKLGVYRDFGTLSNHIP